MFGGIKHWVFSSRKVKTLSDWENKWFPQKVWYASFDVTKFSITIWIKVFLLKQNVFKLLLLNWWIILFQLHKIIGFGPLVLQIVMGQDIELPVRQAAVIYLKNMVILMSRNWEVKFAFICAQFERSGPSLLIVTKGIIYLVLPKIPWYMLTTWLLLKW